MKHSIVALLFIILGWSTLFAQEKPYNVAFDITSKDTVDHRMVLRLVSDITEMYPNSNVEVVFYGKSLDMVVQGKSMDAETVMNLVKKKNVAFNVCEIAMQRNKVEKSQLVPGVKVVPDGIRELVMKQGEGWGYIKVSH